MAQMIDSQKLVKIMHDMIQCNDVNELLRTLLKGSIDLVCSKQECYGWVGRFDRTNGEINIVAQTKVMDKAEQVVYAKGMTGKALEDKRLRNSGDVKQLSDYIECWIDTKSAIAVPIMVEKARVLQNKPLAEQTLESKTEVVYRSKPLGVLNIESSRPNKFNKEIEETFLVLCSHAGEIADKIDRATTLESLYQIEKDVREQEKAIEIVAQHDDIMNKLVKDIYDKLSFNFINISWVDRNRENIDSVYMYCHDYSEEEIKEFCKKAKHKLDSNDIQADIIRHGKVDIPDFDDPRFDLDIRNTFNHDRYKRAFLPIVDPSSNSTAGTLEVGYHCLNECIYEIDISSLDRIVNLILRIMERKRAVLIRKSIHDLRSPVAGIRSNASFLGRRAENLDHDFIRKKSNDIFNDCESLRYSINQLEYALTGRLTRSPTQKSINIYTDVIAKSINQRKARLPNFELHYRAVPEELQRIEVTTDIGKLMQVMHNLFDNAEKYCNRTDVYSNEIFIYMKREKNMDRNGDDVCIYFQDRGIGIKENYRDDVFKLGFRDPDIIKKEIGSGLGLTIAKDLMHEIGGNLELVNCRNPTLFKLTLPRNGKNTISKVVGKA
jgi:signal transduction histidine kinase/putative methionine-R-sulfoxide reductase with GAF domain